MYRYFIKVTKSCTNKNKNKKNNHQSNQKKMSSSSSSDLNVDSLNDEMSQMTMFRDQYEFIELTDVDEYWENRTSKQEYVLKKTSTSSIVQSKKISWQLMDRLVERWKQNGCPQGWYFCYISSTCEDDLNKFAVLFITRYGPYHDPALSCLEKFHKLNLDMKSIYKKPQKNFELVLVIAHANVDVGAALITASNIIR